MSLMERFFGKSGETTEWDELDPAMKQALGDFKASVHAWSGAMANRPRMASPAVVRRTWRLAVGSALASVLIAGAVSGGFYEDHQRQDQARIAAAREAAQQRELAVEKAKATENLLASVDKDVSQEVPDALEPLAALSAQDDSK